MATNNPIQDVLDKARKVHEPYAKKNPNSQTFATYTGRSSRRGSRSSREERGGGSGRMLTKEEIEAWKAAKAQKEADDLAEWERERDKKRQEVTSDFVDKIEPIKATTAYGSYENIIGQDLISITPRAKDFKNAILETSQPLNHEVMYVFDDKGNTVAKWGGKAHTVDIEGMNNFNYTTTIHNHPRQYGSYGTFSPQDISSYVSTFRNIDHYVVTEKTVFKFNIGNLKKQDRERLVNDVKKRTDELYSKEYESRVSKHNTIYNYFMASEEFNSARDKMMKDLAKEYGFEYSSTPIEDFKKRNNIV